MSPLLCLPCVTNEASECFPIADLQKQRELVAVAVFPAEHMDGHGLGEKSLRTPATAARSLSMA